MSTQRIFAGNEATWIPFLQRVRGGLDEAGLLHPPAYDDATGAVGAARPMRRGIVQQQQGGIGLATHVGAFAAGAVAGSIAQPRQPSVVVIQGGRHPRSRREERDTTGRDTAAGVAGGVALLAGAALLGAGEKERRDSSKCLEQTQRVETLLKALPSATDREEARLVFAARTIVDNQKAIDERNVERTSKSFWTTIGLVAGGAILLVGALFSAPFILIAGVVALLASGALKLGFYCYHMTDETDNHENLVAMSQPFMTVAGAVERA